MGHPDRDLFFGDFERDGEEVVRANLEIGRYLPPKRALAKEWIRLREQAREDERQAAEMDLARRATEAAESAAKSAREANRIANQARNIAYGAGVIALLAVALTIIELVTKHA